MENIFKDNLKNLRLEKGIGQVKLANDIGVKSNNKFVEMDLENLIYIINFTFK